MHKLCKNAFESVWCSDKKERKNCFDAILKSDVGRFISGRLENTVKS